MNAEPLFTPVESDPGTYTPSVHTRGPWDPGAMHGGAPSALLANALQELAGDMSVARMTFEFLGPVPIEPVTVEVSVLKPGTRFQLLEGRMSAGGRDVVLVRAVALMHGDVALPDDARWASTPPPRPASGTPKAFPSPPGGPREGMHLTGMDIRWLDGSVAELGPGSGWFRLAHPLLAGADASPIARVCAAADFGNGASRVLDFNTHLFINTDLSISLVRPPRGEWVMLDAVTRIDPSGVGWASSTIFDEEGPIGFSQQTLFVSERTAG